MDPVLHLGRRLGLACRRGAAGRGEAGQALAEFALLLPVLALLVLGLLDFGRLFYQYISAANAAREGARYCVLQPGASQADLARRVISSGTSPDTAELAGYFPTAQVHVSTWSVAGTAPQPGPGGGSSACPAVSGEQDIVVRVTIDFAPVTPLVEHLLPQNPLPVGGSARMAARPS
jgi:Flp pilus assembly protein TadG